MRKTNCRVFFMIVFASIIMPGFSQEIPDSAVRVAEILDSLRKSGIIYNDKQEPPQILLTTQQAVSFLKERNNTRYWNDPDDPLRQAIDQLVYQASHPPYDSSDYYLKRYPFDSLKVSWDKFYIWEPLKFKIPVVSPLRFTLPRDSIEVRDTVDHERISDSLRLPESELPGLIQRPEQNARLKDTSILVVVDTLHEVGSDYPGFPFTFYNYPYQADSMMVAVKQLIDYLAERDSSIINVTGLDNKTTPVWLNSKSQIMHRYWLKNDMNDSVTVWIGAPSRNTIGLYLENGVSFRRPVKAGVTTDARVEIQEIDRSRLLEVQKITVKHQYWKYRSEAAFALNQASLTNWVKGGESSVSVSTDITGYANYENKALKMTSNNFARLKYGLIKSGDNGVRKNLDLLETNSKLNHKAFGKFDFSAILLFKTQLAKGYTYPTDTTRNLVSKFMNPATLTAGFGLDYKPNKTTSINFSPLSYKGTFVTDTTGTTGMDAIDQTKYGIPAGKKSKNEPGASFMITNEYKPVKTVTITNRLQLFTNYIQNPQNIDIDWEMILTANLNWFTDMRLNTHLIFDDDTKTPVYKVDKNKNKVPVLGPDGKQKKASQIQFKELLGFSFVFRF